MADENLKDYDILEQYDYSDGEYLEKVIVRYAPLIGLFLINFSILEQELNESIANFISERGHEPGFVIIERLTTGNKIELFYKIHIRLESFKAKNNKKVLVKIRKQLEELNAFRNSIVHANWQSLTIKGFVRTKIVVDNEEGYVKFKKIEITPKIISQKIKEIEKLTEEMSEYSE